MKFSKILVLVAPRQFKFFRLSIFFVLLISILDTNYRKICSFTFEAILTFFSIQNLVRKFFLKKIYSLLMRTNGRILTRIKKIFDHVPWAFFFQNLPLIETKTQFFVFIRKMVNFWQKFSNIVTLDCRSCSSRAILLQIFSSFWTAIRLRALPV